MALLPCDADGACMVCKKKPDLSEILACRTCATPWHLPCFPSPPFSSGSDSRWEWECPDCSDLRPAAEQAVAVAPADDIVSAIHAIQSDPFLTDEEKAKKRQQLLAGSAGPSHDKSQTDDIFSKALNCSICMQLPERPVTTPCGHNFCLKCFEKWVRQRSRKSQTCANCRAHIPAKMASQPRINSQLAMAIRLSKISKAGTSGPPRVYHHVMHNQDRPDTAFTTERAKKTGKANACSGRIFVTVPADYFGPILPENDPMKNRGVLVGDTWDDRMDCRQWGVHLPHVAGIAGQSAHGAQSVALSGGYEDDEDHGEWFLYTGSGGRDLSGNKRTNKEQSFDQTFDCMNEALRLSCRKGYPVRVVRSYKEKRSAYAPESGVRYDGVYRIEKCWRKNGKQGLKVCRYLFVRCDNEPAPWTSDEQGDSPRVLPKIDELKDAVDIYERKGSPSWDYDVEKKCWLWVKPQPESKKSVVKKSKGGTAVRVYRKTKDVSVKRKLLKEFGCQICRKVMSFPLTTPCAHNFCKACLEGVFSGQSFVRNRACAGGRSLRAQKNIMKCPTCSNDIADFLQNPQVNREMMSVIESLQQQAEQDQKSEESSDKNEENLDDAGEVSNPDDPSENILEEVQDNDVKKSHKRRK